MNPFKTYASISPKKYKYIEEFLTKDIQIPAYKPKSSSPKITNKDLDTKEVIDAISEKYKLKQFNANIEDINGIPKPVPDDIPIKDAGMLDRELWKIFKIQPEFKPKPWFNYNRAFGLRLFLVKFCQFVVKNLLAMFVMKKVDQFTAKKIHVYLKEGKLYDWMKKQVEDVYKKHPVYEPVPIEEFVDTGVWERNAAEWRDKNRDQFLTRLKPRFILAVITFLCTKIPSPVLVSNIIVILVVKIILGFLGFPMVFGSLHNIVVSFEGNSVIMGLTLTTLGYELSKPELYVRRRDNGKLVCVDLEKPPLELYLPTKEGLAKYYTDCDGANIEKFKKNLDLE